MLVERRTVAFERAFVLDPALDKVERDLRQPALRELVQILDIDDAVEAHGWPLSPEFTGEALPIRGMRRKRIPLLAPVQPSIPCTTSSTSRRRFTRSCHTRSKSATRGLIASDFETASAASAESNS